MDPQKVQNVFSLVGCLYYVPPLDSSGTPQLVNRMKYYHNPSLASTSSTQPLLQGTNPSDARLMACAIPISFACLVGDSGESMVSSTPVAARLLSANLNIELGKFMISYPMYSLNNGSHIALVFPVELAYYAQTCEVCIMKPVGRPFLRTRCLDVADELMLEHRDPIFCFYRSASEDASFVVDGKVSLAPSNPSPYDLIADFALALDMRAGVITDIRGRIVGTHVCDFTITEGDDILSPMSMVTRRANSIAKVEIRDNIEPMTPEPRNFDGLPVSMLNQVRDIFASKSRHRKEPAQQSRIYMMNQASAKLFFFQKKLSLLSSLSYLMVRTDDMDHNEPVCLSTRQQHSMYAGKHKRQRLWHIPMKSRGSFVEHGDDEDEDIDNED
ncbi:hypothetical protein GOP47_0013010 [Adiantum capillus-veneris]|uniref:Uncharacterized protein n=1 Tax=Adiantum capillus-veneris TaxID=13818 RepID=A0A9D4URR9_ADICA|nr:hypothetical protein GOP47_0013010 [Adiantum capillus-veneris]